MWTFCIGDASPDSVSEDARLLHDTLLSTLGRLADGANDTRVLGEACTRDATRAAHLLESGVAHRTGLRTFSDLRRVPTAARLIVVSTSHRASIERAEAIVPRASLGALFDAAAEAIRNADEHARADDIIVRAEALRDGIRICVIDSGVGFDIADAGFGVNHSILRRCRDAGADVDIAAVPRQGTRVQLTLRATSMTSEGGLPPVTRRSVPRPLTARQMWRLAGVGEAIDLLRRVADRPETATNDAVRRNARLIEASLRTTISVDPELRLLGPWIVLAAARARARGATMALRGGVSDAPDTESARTLGRMLLSLISRCAAGDDLVLGLFGTIATPHYTLTGPRRLGDHLEAEFTTGAYAVRSQPLGERWFAEVVLTD